MYSVFRETEWICPVKTSSVEKNPLFLALAKIQDFVRLFLRFFPFFLHSKLPNCTWRFQNRKIISDGRHCNTEPYLLPVHLSRLLMITHNSLLNDSGCHSVWQATKVTLCSNQQILAPNARFISRFQFKGAV